MRLNLGVLDIAYSDAKAVKKALGNSDHVKASQTETTGEVAEILEAKYHIMATFFELRQEKISEWLADSVADEIADIVSGKRPNRDPFYAATQKIEAEFRAFLDANEMAHLVAGLSDGESAAFNWRNTFDSAGKSGVIHRKKKPYAADNAARPAFVDTGLFQACFRTWVSQQNKTE